jgi:ribosomal protein S25
MSKSLIKDKDNFQHIEQLSQVLVKAQVAYEQMIEMNERLQNLETQFNHQINDELTDEGWMKLAAAAKRCGLTVSALRQRIKREQYPQNIVWKQRNNKNSIFINVKKLREYL